MKDKIKFVFKYVRIFVVTVAILFLALVLTAKIPQNTIKENIVKSGEKIYQSILEKSVTSENVMYKFIHYYGDVMILNIMYYIDSDNPMNSAMEAKYYSESQDEYIMLDLNQVISENDEANTQYIRYWHGSMSILRPLLVFFEMDQIYIINAVILVILIIILLFKLRKIKKLVVAIIIGLIMCYAFAVPFCAEYTWNFLIMLISSIIAVNFVKRGKNTNIIFFLTGIITCYLDFLTTEIITLFIPLIIILTIKYENKEINILKEGLMLTLKSVVFWTIGYVGMWFAKWILASIILKDVNIFDCIVKPAIRRISDTTYIEVGTNMRVEAIKRNVKTLFPINFLLEYDLLNCLIGCILAIEVIFIYKKEFKKLWFSLLLTLIALIPYLRYIVIATHSYEHYFFTFRTQLITIVSIILAICYSLDNNILKYQLKRKKKI